MNLPDPNTLIDQLAERIRPDLRENSALVGIHTGGVWVMEALAARLGHDLPQGELPQGVLDIAFYRDDFSRIGLHPETKPSRIPFDIEDRHILLIDDVLFTGRTIRAAMNLLFDYGRPASIKLAVLVERSGRELPICADYAGVRLELEADQHVSLERNNLDLLHLIGGRKA